MSIGLHRDVVFSVFVTFSRHLEFRFCFEDRFLYEAFRNIPPSLKNNVL